MDPKLLDITYKKAQRVLRENTFTVKRNGISYRRIIPSKEFYVHQWNWDSATHAMGLIHFDEELAYDEIRSLLSGQWENGLVPQITFNPHEKKYFPGPEFWGTEKFATGEIITSGITQPPLLAISVEYIYLHAKNRKKAEAFLTEVLPKVMKYHEYLKKYRDPEGSGLLTIIHPWESGTDNSPRFDDALEEILLSSIPEKVKEIVHSYRTDDKEGEATHRPRLHDYYRYMHLVTLYKEWGWDYEKIVKDSPFAMKDILFSSIWSRANGSLSRLLEKKKSKDAERYRRFEGEAKAAIRNSWNKKLRIYTDTIVTKGINRSVLEDTIATLMPIYAGVPEGQQLKALLSRLNDKNGYASVFPVPSTPLDNPKFDLARYWRGPSWPITNLFLIDGLEAYTESRDVVLLRNAVLKKTLQMITKRGFFEYYDPLEGFEEVIEKEVTLGFGSFSWTAAIFIYLLQKTKNVQ